MFTIDTVVLADSIPLAMINALYRYYEDPKHKMTIGEMYLLLKLLISNIENEMESMGLLNDIQSQI